MRALPILSALLVCGSIAFSAPLHAQSGQPFDRDGWYTWQVEAIDDAPSWCCYAKAHGSATTVGCDLDGKTHSYGASSDFPYDMTTVRVFARSERGRLTRVRAVAADCPVTGGGNVNDLGDVAAAESVTWLMPVVEDRNSVSRDALAAIAVHKGDAAFAALEQTARTDAHFRNRKAAVFWLGQVRIGEGGELLRELMRKDDSIDMRKHAVFSYSQSAAPDRESALMAIVEDSGMASADRKNALFWVVQTDSSDSIDYIQQLLTVDD